MRKSDLRYYSASVARLEDLPNVGVAVARDLRAVGITTPEALRGADPTQLYERICVQQGVQVDLCLLDVLMSVVAFVHGAPRTPWWFYTPERKRIRMQHIDTAVKKGTRD